MLRETGLLLVCSVFYFSYFGLFLRHLRNGIIVKKNFKLFLVLPKV